jgi:hypothetical protein
METTYLKKPQIRVTLKNPHTKKASVNCFTDALLYVLKRN